mmetsp:Transcript_91399/g.209451  ORF Transcript_91399/g.209451 Transcript_91399/m.209451 type:complete len:84 (+) Transcript_91399:102-353(+)
MASKPRRPAATRVLMTLHAAAAKSLPTCFPRIGYTAMRDLQMQVLMTVLMTLLNVTQPNNTQVDRAQGFIVLQSNQWVDVGHH